MNQATIPEVVRCDFCGSMQVDASFFVGAKGGIICHVCVDVSKAILERSGKFPELSVTIVQPEDDSF
jgi:hypothetical protein